MTSLARSTSELSIEDLLEQLAEAAPSHHLGGRHSVTRRLATPLGPMLAAASDEGVSLLEFIDRRRIEAQLRALEAHIGGRFAPGDHPLLTQLEAELSEYFAGERQSFELPLHLAGTAFQEVVWGGLLEIPYGETRSYAQLAASIGRPGSSRAVGRANGDNRLALLVPCHRVVRADGQLSGYAGGVWRKRALLDLERGSLLREA
jgi:AraC family transcriptional regulator of adaptative response/methylated-DNA-[protein]-cysteine methyltransferase